MSRPITTTLARTETDHFVDTGVTILELYGWTELGPAAQCGGYVLPKSTVRTVWKRRRPGFSVLDRTPPG